MYNKIICLLIRNNYKCRLLRINLTFLKWSHFHDMVTKIILAETLKKLRTFFPKINTIEFLEKKTISELIIFNEAGRETNRLIRLAPYNDNDRNLWAISRSCWWSMYLWRISEMPRSRKNRPLPFDRCIPADMRELGYSRNCPSRESEWGQRCNIRSLPLL